MEKRYTVGIAGHAGHGKTSLVQVLSGVDTDRLKTEKQRGLSIEFGVAPLVLPSGRQISLIDVPGHREFTKNTLRGLSAVDAAILVVSAAAGVMPQTREHYDILRYFGVRTGIAVLSKADAVDGETLAMAALELQDLVKGSLFDKGPIMPFSSLDKRGSGDILAYLDSLDFSETHRERSAKPFRMFIDQIRIFQGLGTVVSGTVLSGTVRRGDRLVILPAGRDVRVRTLEFHHRDVEEASSGSRVGINLKGIGAEEITRGMVLAAPGSLCATEFLNTELELRSLPGHYLITGETVHVHIGSAVVRASVAIMGRDRIEPGERGLAQFRLAEPVGVAPRDRLIVTPMKNPSILGGGKVLETTRIKFRQAQAETMVPYLTAVRSGDPRRILHAAVTAYPTKAFSASALGRSTGLESEVFETAFQEQVSSGYLIPVGAQTYMTAQAVVDAKGEIVAAIKKALVENARQDQFGKAFIADSLPLRLDPPVLEFLLQELISDDVLTSAGGGYAWSDPQGKPGVLRDPISAQVLSVIEASGTVSLTVTLVCEALGQLDDQQKIKKILGHLVTLKRVVMLDKKRYISQTGLTCAKERIRAWIREHGRFLLSECNEVLGCGRKIGQPLIEHLDAIGFTVRRDDERVLKS